MLTFTRFKNNYIRNHRSKTIERTTAMWPAFSLFPIHNALYQEQLCNICWYNMINGLSDMGEECNAMAQTRHRSLDPHMADHELHMCFTFSGVRFPIAHFANNQATASQIYHLFWKAVCMLDSVGFTVIYTSMDGAQNNRTFLNMCFPDHDSVLKRMSAKSPLGYTDTIMIMDYSHVMTKLRNHCWQVAKRWNVSSSSSQEIHYQDAYECECCSDTREAIQRP